MNDEAERLVRVETKLDILIERKDDHETRIRRVERLAWLVAGAAGLAGGYLAKLLPMIGG